MKTRTPRVLSQLVLVATAVACTAQPTVTTPASQGLGLVDQESVQQAQAVIGMPNTVVLGPGESATLSASLRNTTRYVCSTGRPLICDRFNNKLFCFCEGTRQPR